MFPVRSTDLKGDVQRGKIEPREPQHRAAPAELPQSGPHMRAKPCHSPGNTTQCMKPQGHPTMEVPPKRPYPPLQKYSVRPKIMLDLLLWFLKYSRVEKYIRIYVCFINTLYTTIILCCRFLDEVSENLLLFSIMNSDFWQTPIFKCNINKPSYF